MKKTFHGGLTFDSRTDVGSLPFVVLTPPDKIYIPMKQGAHSNCVPCVKVNDYVRIGDMVGAPEDDDTCVPVHSGVSGTVCAIERRICADGEECECVVIENDRADALSEYIFPSELTLDELTPEMIIESVREAGIITNDDSHRPLFSCLRELSGKCSEVFIDCTDSYFSVSSSRALFANNVKDTLNGAKILLKALGVRKAHIVLGDDQQSELDALNSVGADRRIFSFDFVIPKYPLSDPRLIVSSLTKSEYPSFETLTSAGYAVFDPVVCMAAFNAVVYGVPYFERIVTVDGSVATRANLLVPIGATVGDLIAFCGGDRSAHAELSGDLFAYEADASVPIDKTVRSVYATDPALADKKERSASDRFECTRCGKCAKLCPMLLQPQRLAELAKSASASAFEKARGALCSECGICSFVCPVSSPLEYIKKGKKMILTAQDVPNTEEIVSEELHENEDEDENENEIRNDADTE